MQSGKHRLFGGKFVCLCFVFLFFSLWFCTKGHSEWGQRELEHRPDLSASRAGQSAPFDGAADIKQLPLTTALRKRCYRSMGHTLATPPNSFSTLSKQSLLCIYLHREFALRNSIELLNSICALIYSLVGESEWKVNLITQCVAFERSCVRCWFFSKLFFPEWTYII